MQNEREMAVESSVTEIYRMQGDLGDNFYMVFTGQGVCAVCVRQALQ